MLGLVETSASSLLRRFLSFLIPSLFLLAHPCCILTANEVKPEPVVNLSLLSCPGVKNRMSEKESMLRFVADQRRLSLKYRSNVTRIFPSHDEAGGEFNNDSKRSSSSVELRIKHVRLRPKRQEGRAQAILRTD